MQWVDWAILIIIGISAGISLLRGFVREAMSLAGWVLAFFVAKGFYIEFSSLLKDHIQTPSLLYGVSWAVLFLVTLAVTGLVNYTVGTVVEKAGLSGMDRIMGMAFGALRGVLIVAALILALRTFTHAAQDPWWKKSSLIKHVEVIGDWFYDQVKNNIPDIETEISIGNNS